MIPYKFELEGYCEGCVNFQPDLESIEINCLSEPEEKALHTIRCGNRQICARVTHLINQGVILNGE